MLICGIDEAGRGPLIGPMVIAGVCLEEEATDKLRALGVTDSKLLSPLRREQLFDTVKDLAVRFHIVIINPQEIDDAVNSKTTNLNFLEGEKSVEIINKLKPEKAILDCPSTNPEAYKQFVSSHLTENVSLVVEHKADLHYTESAAASILAKVTRDRAIEDLKKEIKIDFGSGYPADPRTTSFLRDYGKEYPHLFRKSWKTYQKMYTEDKKLF